MPSPSSPVSSAPGPRRSSGVTGCPCLQSSLSVSPRTEALRWREFGVPCLQSCISVSPRTEALRWRTGGIGVPCLQSCLSVMGSKDKIHPPPSACVHMCV
ncbi:hypothetical protein AALO_G00121900 [Alosa alosa]|uniref:Uncharacterized protein n=1 Tax=Alosa alosa TaxID=278164 RepID=A0AAV6GM85_9TELE|nr:hypothetical protein AALO_G00121900 [Alosa alosa]